LQAVKNVSAQLAFLLIALLAIAPFAQANTTTTTHKKSSTTVKSSTTTTKKSTHASKTTAHGKHSKAKKSAKKSWKTKGQKTIASERTREIQEALIQQHYLDGEANGEWDTRTQEACRKFQAANGWQTKVLPDSRALIKLGLGPDHKDVLNPETAATSPYLPGGGVKSDSVPEITQPQR
jgi:Putative peptidoglycan binding domain